MFKRPSAKPAACRCRNVRITSLRLWQSQSPGSNQRHSTSGAKISSSASKSPRRQASNPRCATARLELSLMELRALCVLLGRPRLELEPHDGFVADDPRVVTGLDHVRVAGADLLLGAVVVGDVHRPRLQDADVPHLTALASG